jgi:hypothetical protein
MMSFEITEPVALAQLADEIAAALALPEPPALVARDPGQVDEDDEPVPGVVCVPDDLDRAKVQAVIDAHTPPPVAEPVPPLTDDEITALRSMLAGR